MRVVFPAIGVLCLAVMIIATPYWTPRHMRQRAAALAQGLKERHGFVPALVVEHVLKATAAPPFHYGTHHRFDDAVTGILHDMPVTSASYTCKYNGSTHLYGVVAATLPRPVETLELRAGPVFSTAWVIDTPPNAFVRTGVKEFDARFELYAPDREEGADGVLTQPGVRALQRVSEPFSMRTNDRHLLLWRRDGWSTPEALADAVAAAATAAESTTSRRGRAAASG